MLDNLFFKLDLSNYSDGLPDKFTFPFYYIPHPLAKMAADQLQQLILNKNLNHNFGLNKNNKIEIGKMFGVLVCKNELGEIGYLAAVSGELLDKNTQDFLVPGIARKVDDSLEKVTVSKLNQKINFLENGDNLKSLIDKLKNHIEIYDKELEQLRKEKAIAKKNRKTKRLSGHDEKELVKESIFYKKKIESFKKENELILDSINKDINDLENEIKSFKAKRKNVLKKLQLKIFSTYNFLNYNNDSKNILELFEQVPPSGAGDCAAPKLLQYAFVNNLTPICMAEFWWGAPHKSSIRKHKSFYPSCRSKCEPILNFMLTGLEVDDNPMTINYGKDKEIKVLYEDSDLIVINKPEGLLSVPGKNIYDSVATRLNEFMIVHRLDQETSGIMVLAKNKKAHKHLQKQFVSKEIQKTYRAVLSGEIKNESGEINLPLRVDLDNRPQQVVCYQYGKHAKTRYKVIEMKNNETYIEFYPVTGRTHQLRVHSAHQLGLNTPIKGDTLYGVASDRLYLHAYQLKLTHPFTNKTLGIISDDYF